MRSEGEVGELELMTFPDFIPIEYRGMSILTALTFFFYSLGFIFFYSTLKRDLKRINNEIIKHDHKLDDGYKHFSEIQTDIALLLQSVNRIEKTLEKERR